MGRIDFDDLNWERKPVQGLARHRQSWLANLPFTAELQRRLSAAGPAVLATAAHPGYAATNLQFHSQNCWMDLISKGRNRVLASRTRTAAPCRRPHAAVADIP